MGKYTLELGELLDMGFPLWDFNYPIFDEDYRKELENKITNHFWFDEIGQETPERFKQRLESKLNVIMPYYNQRYRSTLLKFDPLSTYVYKESFNRRQTNEAVKDYLNSVIQKSSLKEGQTEQTESKTESETISLVNEDGNIISNGTSETVGVVNENGKIVSHGTSEKTTDRNDTEETHVLSVDDKTYTENTNSDTTNKTKSDETVDANASKNREFITDRDDVTNKGERFLGDEYFVQDVNNNSEVITKEETNDNSTRDTTGTSKTVTETSERVANTPQANIGMGAGITSNYLSSARTTLGTEDVTSSGNEKLNATGTKDINVSGSDITGTTHTKETDNTTDTDIHNVITGTDEEEIHEVTNSLKTDTTDFTSNVKGDKKSNELTNGSVNTDRELNSNIKENGETNDDQTSTKQTNSNSTTNTEDEQTAIKSTDTNSNTSIEDTGKTLSSTDSRGEQVSNNAGSETDSTLNITDFGRVESGRRSHSPSALINEWRSTFLNIDNEIISDLEILFMGVF